MAIKFTFELSDLDAETFVEIINSEICRLNEAIQKALIEKRDDHVTWYKGHIVYIEGLKKKIMAGQERVPESSSKPSE